VAAPITRSISYALPTLRALEAESIGIIREVAAEMQRPALLFSGGKDSVVLSHLARKAFAPARVPFPLLHVDTGLNFPEVLAFRDRWAEEQRLRLVVASVLEAAEANRFDALFGGARRDEEKSRAKERVFSFRDEFGQWDPKDQRPEVWSLYNGRVHPGESIRVFPLSSWTELDVWTYIAEEGIPVPSLYFAAEREVVDRGGMLYAVNRFVPLRDGERSEVRSVRYRTMGDANLTAAVESRATDVHAVVEEVASARITERGATRGDDRVSESAMEDRKREGYF
jgi:sulfate adenylyltransferase subunit 2